MDNHATSPIYIFILKHSSWSPSDNLPQQTLEKLADILALKAKISLKGKDQIQTWRQHYFQERQLLNLRVSTL